MKAINTYWRKNWVEVFKEGSNVIKVESWIDIMENAFKAMSIPIAIRSDWRHVCFRKKTSHWWKSFERSTFARGVIESLMWAEFVVMFSR